MSQTVVRCQLARSWSCKETCAARGAPGSYGRKVRSAGRRTFSKLVTYQLAVGVYLCSEHFAGFLKTKTHCGTAEVPKGSPCSTTSIGFTVLSRLFYRTSREESEASSSPSLTQLLPATLLTIPFLRGRNTIVHQPVQRIHLPRKQLPAS